MSLEDKLAWGKYPAKDELPCVVFVAPMVDETKMLTFCSSTGAPDAPHARRSPEFDKGEVEVESGGREVVVLEMNCLGRLKAPLSNDDPADASPDVVHARSVMWVSGLETELYRDTSNSVVWLQYARAFSSW